MHDTEYFLCKSHGCSTLLVDWAAFFFIYCGFSVWIAPFQNYSPATYSQLPNKVIMGQHITIKLLCVIVQRLTLRSGQSKLPRRRSLQPFALEIMFGKGKETASQKCVRVCACVFVHDIPRTSALPWLLILFTEDWIHYSGSSSQSWIVVITVCQGQRLRAGKY